jgi:hypothetical protein
MLKKRIPTIVGLFLLLIGVISGVIFINQGTNFLPRAAPEYTPQKVKITNITDSGFVVSWVTQEPTSGYLKYADNPVNLSTTAVDDRDQLSGTSGEYRTHYVSLQNLKPQTAYYFKLGSQKDQLYDNNGQPFSISLPAKIDLRPEADSVFGTVVTAVDTPAEGAIIYLSLDGATPLSALVKQNGNWAANLSQSRTVDLTTYATYDLESSRINILVQSNEGESTTAVTTTNNDQPVPTIVLGKSNDFTTTNINPTPPPTNPSPPPSSENSGSSKFNLNPLSTDAGNSVTITNLPTDGQFTSPQPEFQGTAPPNTTLTISVHSPTAHTGTATSDTRGFWQWLVPAPLTPGDHHLSITYTDSQGIVHQLERDFVISAVSLQQVDLAYAATPSASPTPMPPPTPTPIPETAPTPTPDPTPRTTVVASESAQIVAGSTDMGFNLVALGIFLIGLGFFTRLSLPGRQQ